MFFRRLALGAVLVALAAPLAQAAFAADPTPPAEADAPKPVVKKFGVWATRCITDPKDTKQQECLAFVNVGIAESKQPILSIFIGYIPKKTDGGMFIGMMTPLGSLLQPGVGVAVDNAEKSRFVLPFVFCVPTGCQAERPLPPESLKAFKAGKEMDVIFIHAAKGQIKAPVKLDGFGAAIASLPKPKA